MSDYPLSLHHDHAHELREARQRSRGSRQRRRRAFARGQHRFAERLDDETYN